RCWAYALTPGRLSDGVALIQPTDIMGFMAGVRCWAYALTPGRLSDGAALIQPTNIMDMGIAIPVRM
ncbi:hypothetical protein, partial [Oceanospirillum beijerinckii]|uniref:hypothetical protein n=1 Tax=Oceanospirillum beijerinckii TaxID=64976 RepID=UPI00055C3A4F